MPNCFKIGQGNQWLRPASAICDFRISHGTANSSRCTSPAALPCCKRTFSICTSKDGAEVTSTSSAGQTDSGSNRLEIVIVTGLQAGSEVVGLKVLSGFCQVLLL